MVSRTKDLLAPFALSVLVGTGPLWAERGSRIEGAVCACYLWPGADEARKAHH